MKKNMLLRVPGTRYITYNTPLKINMETKNGGLEDDFPFQTGDFQVAC